jgi:hypothetical protein
MILSHYIYPFDDHIAIGRPMSVELDLIDCSLTSTPSGIPFLIIEEEKLVSLIKDDDFFESFIADFTQPDGYGVGMSYETWRLYKKQNKIDNSNVQNELQKNKNRNITINMNKARDIWKNKLREDRKPLLEILDVQYIRALERGQTELIQKIVKKKEFLRDITDDPRIENAQNTDDLRQVTIPPNFIEE